MAKTQNKKGKTAGEMYREILSRPPIGGRWAEPLTLDDVTVVGYKFQDDRHCHAYHFDLMNARVWYLLFDLKTNGRVQLVFKAGEPTIQQAHDLAIERGGVGYKPNINAEI